MNGKIPFLVKIEKPKIYSSVQLAYKFTQLQKQTFMANFPTKCKPKKKIIIAYCRVLE